jgi:ABC-2 type transport system permease protein
MGMQKSLEYRADFLMRLSSALFPIVLQTCLWTAIYKGSGADHYGYSYVRILMYTFTAGITAQFQSNNVANLMSEDIHTGQLGNYLVRPVQYAPFRLLQTLGEKLFLGILLSICILGLCIGFPFFTGIGFSLSSVLCFIPVLALGFIVNFLVFFLVGLIGLWFIEVGQLFGVIEITLTVFSGGVFPLEVFGNNAMILMKFLPFMYITYAPVNVLSGMIPVSEVPMILGIQLFWIISGTALAALVWKRGTRQYVPVGG